jgi:teichuronic acid biosynthesis glycosyltransferase TuaC
MRVLTLTPFYPTASDDAAGCFIAEPLLVLEKIGVESNVVAVQPLHHPRPESSGTAPLATWIRYPCIPSGIGLASAGAFLYATLISKIRKSHQANPIDVIHAHAALPCGHAAVLLSRELKIPCVVTVHGLDAFFDKQVRGVSGDACRRIAQFVYASASRVICISDKVSESVAAGAITAVRTTVIYNGADAQMFAPAPPNRPTNVILSVGNLIPIKGHELLLRAFAELSPDFPFATCEIIGDGPQHLHLTKLANDLNLSGKVRLLGRQSRKQVADAMQRCAIFALPSRYEGLGCVYLEAMATEKPVIACRGQGIDEIIHHGVNGWLVPPDDVQSLVEACSVLLRDQLLRQRTGQAARGTILQGLTSAHQASRLAHLYKECAA